MLRVCLRRLCRAPAPPTVDAASGRLTSSAHHNGPPPLERLLEPLVPPTFTALTQISRGAGEELMERVASEGGLRSFLLRHPHLFAVSRVGDVYVARRLQRRREGLRFGHASPNGSRADQHSQCEQPRKKRSVAPEVRRRPPSEVFRQFPTFFVPVEELVAHVRDSLATTPLQSKFQGAFISGACKDMTPEDIVRHCIQKQKEFIDFVSVTDTSDSGPLKRDFVRLCPALARSAESRAENELGEIGENGQTIDDVMEPHRVQEYEQFRVARLIPVVEKFFPISPEMRQEASLLLSEGRSLLHVFVSAPELFEIRETPELSVRFVLHPRYAPTTTHTREELEKKLAEINGSRIKNGLKVPIDRKKRRMLLRQLQFFLNPTPYLDERVWAYALLDALPPDGPVPLSALLPSLTADCLHSTPSNLRSFLSQYSYLFRTVDGDRETLLQRADIPAPEMRPVSSIDAEEILLTIYNNYPRRRHPDGGTCLERCLYALPLPVRLRLRQVDFVGDVLRGHPDKVEVLEGLDAELLKKLCYSEHHLYKLQLFRFVGEYQEELIRRYEALCTKLGHDPNTTASVH